MARIGRISVSTLFDGGSTYNSAYTIVETEIAGRTHVGTIPEEYAQAGVTWYDNVDVSNTTHLDKIFNNGGTNSYTWVQAMTDVPEGAHYISDVYLNQNGFGKGMIYGLAPDGTTYVQNFQACSENGNCVIGWGNYDRDNGNTNIYGNGINVYSNVGTYIRDNTLHLTKTTDGSPTVDNDVALIVGNRSGNHLAIDSNEIIAKASGTTPGDMYLVGDDIYFTSEHAGISMKPYFAKDDSFSFSGFVGAGFVTSSKTKVYFMFPLTRPLIGSPTITATGSFILRQDGYTHGSTASTYVTPTNIEAALISGIGIRIVATFSDTTNAVNNAPIGISWNGSISFS